MPWFTYYGWASETEIPGRYTNVPLPENVPEGYAPKWSGSEWVVIPYTEPPPPAPPPPPDRKITKLAFRNRFTLQEKITIEMAALDNPSADMSTRANAAALRVYLDDVRTATYIDLNRPDTRAGVQQLEAFGLLSTGRALEILDALPTDEEEYNGG